jgi:hypothetical protein
MAAWLTVHLNGLVVGDCYALSEAVKRRHVSAETRSTGPAPRCVVSRTSTVPGTWAASTQVSDPPLL